MAEPKCPQCQAEGISFIVSKDSVEKSKQGAPWFSVVHCNQCGHIYNVITKHVFTPNRGSKLVIPDLKR